MGKRITNQSVADHVDFKIFLERSLLIKEQQNGGEKLVQEMIKLLKNCF